MISQDNMTSTLKSWLQGQPEIEVAILYGSFARNQQHANSDVDLAISCKSKLSAAQKLIYIMQLLDLLQRPVDIIDLREVGQPLLSQIIADGKRLKGSSTKFAEIAIRNVTLNEDFLPLIKRMQEERKKAFFNE